MAQILLTSFAGYPYTPSSLMPDNGLASLAGALIEAGHEVKILDFGTVDTISRLFPSRLSSRVKPLAEKLFLEGKDFAWHEKARFLWRAWQLQRHQRKEIAAIAREVVQEAEDFKADIVGLKLWNGDGFSGSVRIAKAIKNELPDVTVLAGGPQVDYFGTHILEYTDAFDALIAGEGERTVPELVSAIVNGQSWDGISGLIWHDGNEIRRNTNEAIESLDELPLPVYDEEVYPALAGNQKIKIGVVDESRGCPNRCAFCIHPIKSGGKWALKPSRRVISEMERIMDQMGTRYFIYAGSNTSGKVAVEIAEAILREGLDVRYGCFGHVRGIRRKRNRTRAGDPPEKKAPQDDRDLLSPNRRRSDFDLLRESGCLAIFYGLESGSPRILREAFEKPLNLEDAEEVIEATKEAGMRAITSVIYPAPFEDDESRAKTMDFLKRVRPDSVPITIPGMIPGTPWQKHPEKYGFEMADRDDLWEYALTYKIKLLFPPSMWKPLPYSLNGKSSKQMFKECQDFGNDLEDAGILTHVPHEMVLMADALDQADDLKGFRDRSRVQFLSGDTETVAQTVRKINGHVGGRRRVVKTQEPAMA